VNITNNKIIGSKKSSLANNVNQSKLDSQLLEKTELFDSIPRIIYDLNNSPYNNNRKMQEETNVRDFDKSYDQPFPYSSKFHDKVSIDVSLIIPSEKEYFKNNSNKHDLSFSNNNKKKVNFDKIPASNSKKRMKNLNPNSIS